LLSGLAADTETGADLGPGIPGIPQAAGGLADRVVDLIGQADHVGQRLGMVDSEHVLFIGRDPEKFTEPVDLAEADRIEWVPLSSVPELMASGKIWNSGVLIGLLGLLAQKEQA
jgi:hypothetical protein